MVKDIEKQVEEEYDNDVIIRRVIVRPWKPELDSAKELYKKEWWKNFKKKKRKKWVPQFFW